MSLVDQIRATLSALTSPQLLRADDGPLHFSAELTELDRLACAFTDFSMTSDTLANAPLEKLREVADALSQRLTYLLEPIAPIEVDPEHCVVQMRSNPPQKGETGTTYYELMVRRDGHLSLCRYEKQRGADRERIAAHVTREVFCRLADDFAQAAE